MTGRSVVQHHPPAGLADPGLGEPSLVQAHIVLPAQDGPFVLLGAPQQPLPEDPAEAAKAIDPRLSIHDFRIVDGPTHTNVIFDAVLPLDAPISEEEAKEKLDALVASLWENSHPKVHIDRPYI